MPGPSPTHCARFPDDFLAQAQVLVRRRTTSYELRQRAVLVCLLHQEPLLAHGEAAQRTHLHPDTVRRWRKRWAAGDFSLEDRPGRGRKPAFSPS